MSEWSELISVKQEPELDIVDVECDPIIGMSTGNESSTLYNDKIQLQLKERFKGEIDEEIISVNIETEATINNNELWTNCDKTRTHSFQCYMCYTTKQMLKLHIHSIHMLLRPFKCELCLRSFYDKYTLTTHARIHSGERPYTCQFCSKTFRQHSALTKHKRIHTKEKPFQCEVCLKAFSDRSSLIPHRKIHTGESVWNRSFKCVVCNASFIKNSHLVRHNKTKSHLNEAMKRKDMTSSSTES